MAEFPHDDTALSRLRKETKLNELRESEDRPSFQVVPNPEKNRALFDLTQASMRDFVMEQLHRFDCRMEYDSMLLQTQYSVRKPTTDDIVDYCLYVTISCKMESEIPIICLIYIERLLQTGILLNKYNWQRVLLVCLCMASKVWDDDSLEN